MRTDPAAPGRATASPGRFLAGLLLAGFLVFVRSPAPDAASPGNQIIPTGRTATTVAVSGAVTDITTATISSGNAYNDFSLFRAVAGTTVNLQVPSPANNLVNVVRNAPAVVNGILNSYKDGQIGGNVVFADPYGFVVGSQGTINVGSLMVRTPSAAFLDQLINPAGKIDDTAAAALLAGDIPLSPDGRVSIRGTVNARDNVSLAAQTVAIGRNPAAVHAAEFAATVNGTGLKSGAAIIASNGGIDIVAAGAVSVNGRVATGAAPGRGAGPVHVAAGGNIQFGAAARVAARGSGTNSSGGTISVKGSQDLSVAAGATFDTSAGSSGNGGQIEISAAGKQTLGGGVYNAGATSGTPGSVVFDPSETEISGTNTTVGGTDFIDTAANITVDAGAIIVTRQVAAGADPTDPTVASTGNSGNITLNAAGGTITINPGAELLTFATDAYQAGSVTLNAGNTGTIAFPTDPNLTANTVIATRVIPSGSGASLSGSSSSGNSGNITLTAGTLSLGTGINTAATSAAAPGEQFLANAAAASSCSTACSSFTPGTITFNVGSFTFMPGAPVLTEGANLVVNSSGTVGFAAGSLIDTRHQAAAEMDTSDGNSTAYFSPTDPTSSILDNPGNVTINANALSYPSGINTTGGAAIYAGGYGGSYGFLPGTLTFNVPSLTVGGTIGSAGAHLVLNATSGQLTVSSGAVLVTREVAAGTDATDPTNPSKNESGDLTLSTAAGDIVIDPGAQLLTFSTDQYYAGDIKVLSNGHLTFSAPGVGQSPAELVARSVSSTAAATVGFYAVSSANSGNITLSAGNGGSVQLGGGLNSDGGPTVLAGAAVGGTFAYAPGTITINAPAITVAASAPFNTLGANLDLEASSSITLAANATINTRDVSSGADPSVLSNISTGNSGSVTLNAPTVTADAGGSINTVAVGTDQLNGVATAALPGNVTITAGSTLSLASGASGSAEILARGIAASTASVQSGTADAAGGTISITAPAITLTNGVNTSTGYVLLAAGGNGNAAGTIALTAPSFDVSSTILGLGANVALTASSGNVTLENSAVIDTTATNDAAGNITIAGTSVVLPRNTVNGSGSATLLATATGGNSPGTITLSETSNLDYTSASLTVATSGAGFVLQTAGTLSLGANLAIDTRDLNGSTVVGPAGNVSLIANSINLGSGIDGTGTASIQAAGGNGNAPGTITLQWTGSAPVTLDSGTALNSGGANLAIEAAGSVTIGDAATLNAGSNTVSIGGQTVQLVPTAIFDAGAVKLGETSASANFVLESNLALAGIDVSISTDGSITIDQGVILSTRKTSDPFDASPQPSTGNSGSITLSAPSITVLGTLDAGVTNAGNTTWSAGDVSLIATQIEQPVAEFGNTTATTAILIGSSGGAAAVIQGQQHQPARHRNV
jgi:mucin-19